MIYGITLKSRDSMTVKCDMELTDLLVDVFNRDFIVFSIIGNSTWNVGDNKTTKMLNVAIKTSEIESIQYGEIESEE